MQDKHKQELLRLGGLLRRILKEQRYSIRSIEQKLGVGTSTLQKALAGDIALSLVHIFMIADAIGMSWQDFFLMAYDGKKAHKRAALPGAETEADPEPNRKPPEEPEMERLRRQLAQLLLGTWPPPDDSDDT